MTQTSAFSATRGWAGPLARRQHAAHLQWPHNPTGNPINAPGRAARRPASGAGLRCRGAGTGGTRRARRACGRAPRSRRTPGRSAARPCSPPRATPAEARLDSSRGRVDLGLRVVRAAVHVVDMAAFCPQRDNPGQEGPVRVALHPTACTDHQRSWDRSSVNLTQH